jgi:hypothetical protein
VPFESDRVNTIIYSKIVKYMRYQCCQQVKIKILDILNFIWLTTLKIQSWTEHKTMLWNKVLPTPTFSFVTEMLVVLFLDLIVPK